MKQVEVRKELARARAGLYRFLGGLYIMEVDEETLANMKQMQFRCPDARIVGTAEIPNYQLLFKGSKTGSYLTIEPKQGCTVPAAVWSVSERDELALDRYEGYPHFYYKTELELPLAETGKKLTAFVYIMHEENGTTFEEIDSIDFTEKEIDDDALFDEEYENACEFE